MSYGFNTLSSQQRSDSLPEFFLNNRPQEKVLRQLADILLARQETESLHKYQKKFTEIKSQVTEGSVKLQDFYELRSIKGKILDIDNTNKHKIKEVNDRIDSIENEYAEVMKKLKHQSANLSQQLSKITKQKGQHINSTLNQKDSQFLALEKNQQSQRRRISGEIEQKGKLLKKQITNSAKQLNSQQILMRSKFKSMKRNILRTIESQNQRRESFSNAMIQTLSQISTKVQARIRRDQVIQNQK